MVFSSHLFIFYFLPIALTLYYVTPHRFRPLLLTLLSYLFYGWANPAFVLLMLFSTGVDYFMGLQIASGQRMAESDRATGQRMQRRALAISIVTNLALLGFFKYANFGIDSYNDLLSALGWADARWDMALRITLPLGISFYTFQSMSYTIDVYQGAARPVRNMVTFACYVSMFPQLVAGPIVRFREVADQLEQRSHTLEKFARGTAFFSLGLAKKVLIANPCGHIADTCFDAGSVTTMDAWYGLAGYSFQIYFDFSAYSDMAIGLGLMLGFVFPKNFDSPYHAASITEFWRRWHISLSQFLRDYLYIALGGNRRGAARTYANLALVMLIGGLWHGASWNFVIWGGIHGAMLALERLQGKANVYRHLPHGLRVLLTFAIVSLAWVFFRATTLPDAWDYLSALFGI
ncbi:MAG: membrane-bound O-acyltransferase family protein, partial [Candidatus Hydrogenedentes bacterium]|nr:membrane-bound O-acyltransferase family protein [Candidatus Hydrogenedentota bacterium]